MENTYTPKAYFMNANLLGLTCIIILISYRLQGNFSDFMMMPLKDLKVFVMDNAGFIGPHLVDALLTMGATL